MVSQQRLRLAVAVHIVNIDFDINSLKLAFMSTFTTAVGNLTTMHQQTSVFSWNSVPFWCCCVMARRVFHFVRSSSNISSLGWTFIVLLVSADFIYVAWQK